jgi:hypothetical protein
MAELRYIEYPDHLNEPRLREAELEGMTSAQKALARDWNILANKLDWTMHLVVDIRNLQVDHDRLLESVRRIKWVTGLAFGSGTVGGALLYYIITQVLK